MLKIRGVMVFPSQVEDIIADTEGTVKEAWHIYIDSDPFGGWRGATGGLGGHLRSLHIGPYLEHDGRYIDSYWNAF